MEKINVAIAEDDLNCIEEIQKILSKSTEFRIHQTFHSYDQLKENLEIKGCDILILDLCFAEDNALDLIVPLKEKNSGLKIVIHTTFEDTETIIRALGLGVQGYLTKNRSYDLLCHELKSVMMGGAPLTKLVAEHLTAIFEKEKSNINLSPREIEILDLISLGFTYQEIADDLEISPLTVRTHIRNIYEKLNVNSKSEALLKGYRLGFISKWIKNT